jgi:predicted PurR-regulated permease PerM
MSTFDNNKLKQGFFLLMIFSLGYLLISTLIDFMSGFLGALTIYVLFRKFNHYLVHDKKMRDWAVALLVLLIATIVLLMPFIFVAQVAINKISSIVNNPQVFVQQAQEAILKVQELTGYELLIGDVIQQIQKMLSGLLPSLVGSTLLAAMNIVLMYFLLYFMLVNGRDMEKFIGRHLPLKDENTLVVGRKFRELIISNSIVIPLLGGIQAGFSMLGYWIFGVDEIFIYGIMTGVASVIPVLGTMIIWLPLSIVELADGAIWQGVGLFFYGGIIITNVDNLFRFILQKKIANVHPLITILGVILGVKLFGFVGLIFGPILISMFMLLLQIYRQEFVGGSEKRMFEESQPSRDMQIPNVGSK